MSALLYVHEDGMDHGVEDVFGHLYAQKADASASCGCDAGCDCKTPAGPSTGRGMIKTSAPHWAAGARDLRLQSWISPPTSPKRVSDAASLGRTASTASSEDPRSRIVLHKPNAMADDDITAWGDAPHLDDDHWIQEGCIDICDIDCRGYVNRLPMTCASLVDWTVSTLTATELAAMLTALSHVAVPGLDIHGAATVEEEFMRAAWSVLVANIDLVKWADCMYTGPTYSSREKCLERLIGHIEGTKKTNMIWLDGDLSAISDIGNQPAPGVVVLPFSNSLLMWRQQWQERVEMWNSGDPDTMVCVALDAAASLLHELTHVSRYILLDVVPGPTEKCYASHVIENLFRWALFHRFPPTPCCSKHYDSPCIVGCGYDPTGRSKTKCLTAPYDAGAGVDTADSIAVGVAIYVAADVIIGAMVSPAVILAAYAALAAYLAVEALVEGVEEFLSDVADWINHIKAVTGSSGGGGEGCSSICDLCPELCSSNGCKMDHGSLSQENLEICLEHIMANMDYYNAHGHVWAPGIGVIGEEMAGLTGP